MNGTLSDRAFTRLNEKYEAEIEKLDEEIADVAPNLVGRDLTLQHNTNLVAQ